MATTGPAGNDFKSKMAEMSARFTLGQKAMIGGATFAVFIAIMMLSKAAGGGEDMTSLFNLLTGYSAPPRWNRLLVAPLGLHEAVLGFIARGEPRGRGSSSRSWCR